VTEDDQVSRATEQRGKEDTVVRTDSQQTTGIATRQNNEHVQRKTKTSDTSENARKQLEKARYETGNAMDQDEEFTAHTPTNASEHPQSWQPPEVREGKLNTDETLEMESELEELSAEKIDI
jgi:hypothetical protein